MDSSGFTGLDIAIVALLGISATFAFLRGAVREVLALAGWGGAAITTYFGFGLLQPSARLLIETEIIADIAAGAFIFVISFIILWFVNAEVTRRIKESRYHTLDRSLGFLFGLARGVVLVGVAYVVVSWAMPVEQQPGWLREARARPLMEFGASIVVKAIPPEARQDWANVAGDTEWASVVGSQDALYGVEFDADEAFETMVNPPSISPQPDPSGYSSQERKDLDRLMESTQ